MAALVSPAQSEFAQGLETVRQGQRFQSSHLFACEAEALVQFPEGPQAHLLAPLGQALKQRAEMEHLIRVVSGKSDYLVGAKSHFERLAPQLARFAPRENSMFRSDSWLEVMAIATQVERGQVITTASTLSLNPTAIGALEDIQDMLSVIPVDEAERLHHVHRLAHDLANAARYLGREKRLSASARAILERVIVDAGAEERRFCRQLGGANRIEACP